MKYYPVFLDLEDRLVVIAGGGEQAAQKLRLLLKTPARLLVVAASINDEIASHEASGRFIAERRDFEAGDLEGAALVYAATGDAVTNEAIATAARARGIPVNTVDAPALCDFLTPAIVDRDPVTVAIGSEGAAPVLARSIKSRIEAELPADIGRVAVKAEELRDRLASEVADPMVRRRVWDRLIGGAFASQVLSGDAAGASETVAAEISAARGGMLGGGHVALIGCGPGDPDQLTLRALQRLQQADVLVVDRLVDPRVLDYARRDAERIHVGKVPGGPSTSQDEINRILVREASAGKIVARLKGGDPFIFGRASEEMSALARAGLSYEVVPGVTSAHACAASVGLPVTSRGVVRKFSLLTGATADGEPDHDWSALAGPGQAFAIYMGVRSAGLVRDKLIEAGADPATPVVVVENGTLPDERAFATTLDDLEALVDARRISGPSMIFVGLDWSDMGLETPTKIEHFARPKVLAFDKAARPMAALRAAG
ncbi:MAG: siroheme synthase CysG [Pseudomonadota bacterium]|nr:siroheme synthase CysG [Pseudomonadota bacterium]